MYLFLGLIVGAGIWFVLRCIVGGLFTVDQNERAVKTSFGRAERLDGTTTLDDPIAQALRPEERELIRPWAVPTTLDGTLPAPQKP